MNLTRVNLLAYRSGCVLVFIILILGTCGVFAEHYKGEAIFGVSMGIIIGICAFRGPSVVNWITIVLVLLVAVGIVYS